MSKLYITRFWLRAKNLWKTPKKIRRFPSIKIWRSSIFCCCSVVARRLEKNRVVYVLWVHTDTSPKINVKHVENENNVTSFIFQLADVWCVLNPNLLNYRRTWQALETQLFPSNTTWFSFKMCKKCASFANVYIFENVWLNVIFSRIFAYFICILPDDEHAEQINSKVISMVVHSFQMTPNLLINPFESLSSVRVHRLQCSYIHFVNFTVHPSNIDIAWSWLSSLGCWNRISYQNCFAL